MENRNNTKIRMIEAFEGSINHPFDDGLYIHTGDFLACLEREREIYEEETDFANQETMEKLIAWIQAIILSRQGGTL